MSALVETLYEPHIQAARNATDQHPCIVALLKPDISPHVLERFLIEYCSRGVHVTEPVEGWIRRAGERCKQEGIASIGDALIRHATHEADHHLMFIEDTKILVARWNQRGGRPLQADALIDRPHTEGMARYIRLHEDTIASDIPFAQVAIELEIERLSTTILPRLLEQFQRVLGREILAQLSFLTEHAALDVGHTHLNARMLEKLLLARPQMAQRVAQVGAAALAAYLQFFEECLRAVQSELGRVAA